ncbi:hypothetical protein LM602_03685 [Candidatus Acetothermia bacterium]|nr:hypothetical protein [Candidatus Acetothermia bacterium]MCI2431643.1 hypothetical protein [Candidatus Acetothermia bacterium]MCI2436359.1 hypothetical protein [Candidatus Acetothermia bacterium]
MFRRFTALVCALALAGALSWGAMAAPITGSFGIDIIFYPDPTGGVAKIDQIVVKFEADLVLALSISGVDLTSTTLFTFKGVEVQLFSLKATVGPMSLSTILVFAPSIIEFEEVRSGTASRGYCIRAMAPNVDSNALSSCPGFSAGINDPVYGQYSFFSLFLSSPSLQNLILGRWADNLNPNHPLTGGSNLTPVLTFRKKIAEATLSIAGLTLGLRGLFANLGSVAVPAFESGFVLILAGTTVSGISVRSETWFGARQGFECFGECKPASRIGFTMSTFAPYPAGGGIVVPGMNPEEEKLFISGLTLAGVRNSIAIEFVFAGSGASSLQPTNMQITSTTPRITPIGLTITNIARFAAGLSLARNIVLFGIRVGEASATVQIDYRPTAILAWEPLFTALILTFDPPGGTATVVVINCQTDYFAGFTRACRSGLITGVPGGMFIETDYYIEFEVGDLKVSALAVMLGSLLKELYSVSLNATWTVGNVSFASETYLFTNRLGWQAFNLSVKF